MTTLLIRKDTKQAFAGAAKLPMLDSAESLAKWVDALNETTGWKKYGVAAA